MGSAGERGLTTGEIALAKKIYGSSIDYAKVKVHDGKYKFFQPSNSGMTPNGEIYVHGAYRADYSAAIPALKGFYIHEMVHVYQYQLKILDPIIAAIGESISHSFDYDKAYVYTLDASKDLLDYGIEQQAQIIEDYFRTKFLNLSPVKGFMQNKMADVIKNNLFGSVLSKFLVDPGYARHIIECKTKRLNGGRRIRSCKRVLVK